MARGKMQKKKFIVTKELGKLAKWLRILGYDSTYSREKDVPGLVILALREKRVLLTRSPGLSKYKGIRTVIIKHDHVEEQIEQVAGELKLPLDEDEMFHICVECNAPLQDINKKNAEGKVPEYVFRTQEEFKQCPKCDKIFWKGTHWDMVSNWLEKKGIERRKEDGGKKNKKESRKGKNSLEQ
jgi:uncharacterized protein with PIN domain